MKRLGYETTYHVLNAKDFGILQYRERVFTISCLGSNKFDFSRLAKKEMKQ